MIGGDRYIEDSAQTRWHDNTFINYNGPNDSMTVEIISGPGSGNGAGSIRQAKSMTNGRLVLDGDFTVAPDTTSTYRVFYRYNSDFYYQHAGQLSQESGQWYLYVGGFDHQIVKLNAVTGAIVWTMSTMEDVEPYPHVEDIDGDGQLEVIAVSIEPKVYVLNAATGAIEWTYTTAEGNDAFIRVADLENDGQKEVLISSRDNTIYVLNNNGTLKWQTGDTGGDIDSQPLVIDRNNDGFKEVYVANDAGKVFAYSHTGAALWDIQADPSQTINSSLRSADVNGDGSLEIVVATMGGLLKVLNPADGSVLSSLTLPDAIEGTILLEDLDSDGIIEMVVTCLDGKVYFYKFQE